MERKNVPQFFPSLKKESLNESELYMTHSMDRAAVACVLTATINAAVPAELIMPRNCGTKVQRVPRAP
jgi:hypothetical protein